MSSAQDPFYIVKEEIQESVSFLCGCLIFVSTFQRKETFVDQKPNGHINLGFLRIFILLSSLLLLLLDVHIYELMFKPVFISSLSFSLEIHFHYNFLD